MTKDFVTDEQVGKFFKRVDGLYERLSAGGVDFYATMDGLQLLAEGKFPGLKKEGEKENVDLIFNLRKKWEKFYKKVFGEEYNFSNVFIPVCPGISNQGWWLIILVKGVKSQRLFEKCHDMFGAWKWTSDDLDKIVTSDRTSDGGHYAVWVRSNVEADPEFKNLSANKLKEMNHKGITLEERLILELFYWWKTKKHLDINNWTLCSGSRYSDGLVPDVNFDLATGGVCVYDDHTDHAVDVLRSREVIS